MHSSRMRSNATRREVAAREISFGRASRRELLSTRASPFVTRRIRFSFLSRDSDRREFGRLAANPELTVTGCSRSVIKLPFVARVHIFNTTDDDGGRGPSLRAARCENKFRRAVSGPASGDLPSREGRSRRHRRGVTRSRNFETSAEYATNARVSVPARLYVYVYCTIDELIAREPRTGAPRQPQNPNVSRSTAPRS